MKQDIKTIVQLNNLSSILIQVFYSYCMFLPLGSMKHHAHNFTTGTETIYMESTDLELG